MRIPLDYYRILSVPIQATLKQLEQAYRDRSLQQPRREYNEQAIQARQELIQHAYQILSNPEQRADYDAQFFVNMQPVEVGLLGDETSVAEEIESTEESVEPTTATEPSIPEISTAIPPINPTIEISSSQLIGALLILHELGEYELALQLGVDFFNSPELGREQTEIKTETQENIILSVTLAYLELGREQWHRQEYENAAVSSHMGIDLLNQENLFPQIKEELQLDLYKLRPYRVLELISQNKTGSPERAKGFELLREMLVQRQGIEGKGQDRSGLSFDQFLCFVQQLRIYLTSSEQQELFDNEAQNDSAIASYLAVYALLGRGFSLKKPELVLRAQRKLDYLSEKQDVAWEQAVCALLLGHTEKAINKLLNSQDLTKLEQVQRHSDLNTDLLPGMCLYGEQWLHEDVIAQFSDLVNTELTLKEYFADRQVQAYLEELAPTNVSANKKAESAQVKQQVTSPPAEKLASDQTSIFSLWRNVFSSDKALAGKADASSHVAQPTRELVGATVMDRGHKQAPNEHNHSSSTKTKNKPKSRQKVAKNLSPKFHNSDSVREKSLSLPLETSSRAVPPSVMQKAQGQVRQKRIARKKKLKPSTLWKGWLFIFSLIFGVGALGFVAMKLFLNPASKTAKQAQLAVSLSQPAVDLPPAKVKPVAVQPKLTFTDISKQVIQNWLSSKSSAFGKEHEIDRLNSILAEPLLATWRDRAQAHQQSNSYREYEHEIKMRSAKIDPQNPKQAVVEAEVKEVAKHYQGGQLDNAQSYDDNLLVRYQLVLQGDNWLIQNAEVLETL